MINDVTNSPKDWDDFWYNSKDDFPDYTNNINPPNIMTKTNNQEPPFDSQAYKNYVEQLDKHSAESPDDLIERIKQIGFRIDQSLERIISRLDVILEDDFDPDKVTCTVDDKKVDCDTWEDVIYDDDSK